MSDRYFITGVQLGGLRVMSEEGRKKFLNDIEEHQFIGAMKEPYDDYEIIIRKKVRI